MAERNIQQKELKNYLQENGLKIDQSTLSKILNGKREIPVKILCCIAEFLQISVDSIVGIKKVTGEVRENIADYSTTSEEKEMLIFLYENFAIKSKNDILVKFGLLFNDNGKINRDALAALELLMKIKKKS